MKTLKICILLVFICVISSVKGFGQTQYTYPLIEHFSAFQSEAPDLIQIPNNSGLTGEFVSRIVPISTCGDGGDAYGYFFEDDAGLQFNNPSGFIDQSYSLAFNFQIDEFVSPSWVRLLSFTHTDDVGVYIYLTNPPTNGTLQFWPYGNVGEEDFFTTVDFYQLILVRNEEGLIKIYINGSKFAEYDDSETQKFIPGDPDHYIIFFRDHPSVLADEASPGFVSDIIIGNRAWTSEEVVAVWEDFCGSLFAVGELNTLNTSIYPNPVMEVLNISLEETNHEADIQVFDILGNLVLEQNQVHKHAQVDVSSFDEGIYFVKIIQAGQSEVHKFSKR